MEARSKSIGVARMYALIFGIAYLGVALTEVILGKSGWKIDGVTILKITALQNAVHWLVGVVVLGSFFAGEMAARWVARVIGGVFVILTVWGFVARDSLGSFLGFSGPLPWSYNIVHLLTAIAALIAGFAVSRLYGATEPGPQKRLAT
jgi:hypothetical protein